MARKKKKHDGQELPANSGAFVPASLENSHSHSSLSFGAPAGDGASASHAAPGSFEQYSRRTVDYSQRKKKGRRGPKVALAIIIIALVAGVGALGFYVYKEVQKQAVNEDLHSMSKEVMEAIDNELTGMTTFDEPFTVLLLGSDQRSDPAEDIGARTDTIILCRIDPIYNIVSMVSIPRDTKVELDGVGTAKINAAYTYGGPSGTIAAVKKLCGVEIDHYAEINFEGLVSLVDAIGGVDVHVDEEITDIEAGDIEIPAGDVHLDGPGALVFARSRAYADGDFTRVKNQRKLIEAIVHRGLSAPSSDLYGLIQASTEFLTTDTAMDVDFIFSLADQIRHNNDYPLQIFSATIPASTDMIGGVSYVIADQAGVDEMMDVFVTGGNVSDGAAEDEAAGADPSELSEASAGSTGASAGTSGSGNGGASSASSY